MLLRARYSCVCFSMLFATQVFAQRDLATAPIGSEHAIAQHYQDGQEFTAPLTSLLSYGQTVFKANFTIQDGFGRPNTKGTGAPLTDASSPLLFPRNMNRISGPDSNSCAGCHNSPVAGGDGDAVGNVFVLGQRFDFASFDHTDSIGLRGAVDEQGMFAITGLPTGAGGDSIANPRATPGMQGSGYIEMLAREITADLQAEATACAVGQSCALTSKGISFGTLTHNADGTWNTSAVSGLPPQAIATSGTTAPTLILQPWSQAGNVVSLRQFTNNAYNHHHGMQTEERFGIGVDSDGDGMVNELTRADITAVSLFQAAMAVPGQVIPLDSTVQSAILNGQSLFTSIGCAGCHIPSLPLYNWKYVEPSPYNPSGNLQTGGAPNYTMDLTSNVLPSPRLTPANGVINVPVFTDFKLHNICTGPGDPNGESLDQNQAGGSAAFFAGNQVFLTKRLWTVGSKPNHFHHGKYTTIRESIVAHAGEALASQQAFSMLSSYDQGSIIEYLKTLKALPAGTKSLTVDENYKPIQWPPHHI